MLRRFVWIWTAMIVLSSCIPNKKVIYLQDLGESTVQYDSLINFPYPEYRLQKGDILNIEVRSSDPTVTEIFKAQGGAGGAGQLANSAADVNYLTGFTLNENGDIELPLVGFLHLSGKTMSKAKESVQEAITKYILDPYISLRLGGIRYSALGEFNRPGRYAILQSQVTLFEAIANAGDLTLVANRQAITLIRQYPEGQRVHQLDLTDREIVKSPFYYIQPNDQLYVEPLKVREIGAGVGVSGFSTFSNILTVISSTVLIIFTIDRLN